MTIVPTFVALALALATVLSGALMRPAAQVAFTLQTIYRFKGGSDGSEPGAGLIVNANGTLFGTTFHGGEGGLGGYGTVFKLSRSGDGFVEAVIYRFSAQGDGAYPGCPLLLDKSGDLFGTTEAGGTGKHGGYGTVFELKPLGTGYTKLTLYRFLGPAVGDGALPVGQLIADAAGNLYGTTAQGGISHTGGGYGTVFELARTRTGYSEHVLHVFRETDGASPASGVTLDPNGDLYGTTEFGGAANVGTIFKIGPRGAGFVELHAFQGIQHGDGGWPTGPLTLGKDGALYGTAYYGGPAHGSVFEWATSGPQYRILYQFEKFDDGIGPDQSVAEGNAALYGATLTGGDPGGDGTLYELTPSPSGYELGVLYRFTGGADGSRPDSPLLLGSRGGLYGTTAEGGSSPGARGHGVVFRLIPN